MRFMSLPIKFLLLLAVSIPPMALRAQDALEPVSRAFTLYWENDSFTGTDRDYSNGIKFTLSRSYAPPVDKDGGIRDWMMNHLPFMNKTGAIRATSDSLGQNIYTPEETDRSDLINDDRPYAGFAYLGFGFVSINGIRRDVWEFDIGVVGPLSQAESIQDWVHGVIEVDKARGWDNQLENELGLELVYESKWQLWRVDHPLGFGIDFIPHVGGRIGNIAVYANVGGEIRFGLRMPQDFGSCPIRPGCEAGSALGDRFGFPEDLKGGGFGVHLFTAAEGRAILRDISLDGNTFKDSHSVDKEILVGDLMGGIALNYNRIRVNFAYVIRSREFKQQSTNHAFGAINFTYLY